MIERPGAYVLSMEDYQSDPAPTPSLSRSIISDLIYKCPYIAWWNHPRLNPEYKTETDNVKFDIGTAAHSLLLEGVDNVAVVDADDWRTKIAKEAREQARTEGKIPLLKHQYEDAQKMVLVAEKAIVECKELGITDLRKDGESELSYFWKENETWCRVRPDWLRHDRKLCLDYKTTESSVNPYSLDRHIVSFGYDIQSSFYRRGIEAVERVSPEFVFCFQEVREPFLCSFISLPGTFMAMAKDKVEWAIGLWRECLRQDYWPGYPQRVTWIELPPWAQASWEAKAQEMSL